MKKICWCGTKIFWGKKEYCHLQIIYIFIKLVTVGLNFSINDNAINMIYNVLAIMYSVLSDIVAISHVTCGYLNLNFS